MGLNKEEGRQITFVGISEGKLYTKKKGEEKEFFGSLTGTITKVKFEKDTYEGKEFERAAIYMVDGDENFCLHIRTDSGYFRGFCNSLRSGWPTKMLTVSAASKEDGGKVQTTCFVKQGGASLKHFYTKDKQGDLPQLKRVRYNGKDIWDGTEQIEFWKNWLLSIPFKNELFAGAEESQSKAASKEPLSQEVEDASKDLPF